MLFRDLIQFTAFFNAYLVSHSKFTLTCPIVALPFRNLSSHLCHFHCHLWAGLPAFMSVFLWAHIHLCPPCPVSMVWLQSVIPVPIIVTQVKHNDNICTGCREASSCPVWSDRKSPPTQSPYCVSTTVPCVITYLARILRSCQYLASAVTHVRIDLARDMLHVTSNKIASSYTTIDPVKTTSKFTLRRTMPSKGLQQDQATPQQDVKNVYHCHTSWGCVNLSGCCPYFGRMQTSGGGVTWPHPSR